MSPTATERGSATRERLLAATAQVIAHDGWAQATTRAVAEEAGVNAGLVHYHFGSVGAPRRAATLRTLAEAFAHPIEALLAEDDAGAGLDRFARALSGYGTDDPIVALSYEALLAAPRDEELRTALRNLLADIRRTLADWLARTTDLPDPVEVAALLSGALDGLFLHHAIDPDLDLAAALAPLRRLLDGVTP